MPNFLLESPEKTIYWLVWTLNLKGGRTVVPRCLVPLSGGPSMTLLKLSAVEVAVGSYLSRILMKDSGTVNSWLQHLHFFLLFGSSRHRSCCHCDICYWASDGLLCRSVCGEETIRRLVSLMRINYCRPSRCLGNYQPLYDVFSCQQI